MDDTPGLLEHRSNVILLKLLFVDNYDALEAFREGLKLEVSTPLSVLLHRVDVIFECAVLILIKEGLIELLMSHHVSTCFLSHDDVSGLASVDLIGKGPE